MGVRFIFKFQKLIFYSRCAYRSLQTIISYLRYKGYSQKPVPTHHEIQQILIDMKDKQKNFYKSNEWIGAFELSLVMEQHLGVKSKKN